MAAWWGLDGFEDIPFPGPSGTADAGCVGPYPDELRGDLADDDVGPAAAYPAGETLSLAFVAALQYLPPERRAALVLCDVLGFPAAEAAEILDSSAEAVAAALSEARTMLAARLPPGWRDRSPRPGSDAERAVARRFADALERGDADAIVAVLTDDAWLALPPAPSGYRSRAAAEFLSALPPHDGPRRFRLIAIRANGQPAFGCYLSDPVARIAHLHSLIVLTLDGDRVSGITRYTDPSILRLFGLPRTLRG